MKLRYLREKAGLTRLELAEQMGVDPSAVRHWERGTAKPRDMERFAAVCKTDMRRLYAPTRKAAEG